MPNEKRTFFSFLIRMYERYKNEQVTSIAGELSYFLLLSLFPLLFVMLQVISFMPINQNELILFLQQYVPGDAMTIIESLVDQILNRPNKGILSFGLIGTLWTASRGSNAVIRSMNRAFHVEESRAVWRKAILSFMIILGIIFVIIFSLLIPIFGQKILDTLYNVFKISIFSSFLDSNIVRGIVTFIVLYGSFSVAYCIIPNRTIKIWEVLPGALFATAGWLITSLFFSFYVDNVANYSATYGSIGSVIVLMTWIYLSCTMLILGGILNSEVMLWRRNKP